jgi:hypothetical protein
MSSISSVRSGVVDAAPGGPAILAALLASPGSSSGRNHYI